MKVWPSQMLKIWGGWGGLATRSGGVQSKMLSHAVARLNEATQHTHKSEWHGAETEAQPGMQRDSQEMGDGRWGALSMEEAE